VRKIFVVFFLLFFFAIFFFIQRGIDSSKDVLSSRVEASHWFLLHRKSNIEYLYKGIPGKKDESKILKTFIVKTGIPGERPTPLPKLLGKEYWTITDKQDSKDNENTAPYFLSLDIPISEDYPFGPVPYTECGGVGQQCNWEVPGYFGLHGINGNLYNLSKENPGSSGCIRHSDEDITYLFNILDTKNKEIRYYVEDI
jgi:hypothetical protein